MRPPLGGRIRTSRPCLARAPTISFVSARGEPLTELLRAVLVRVEDLVAAEERVRSLLDAVSVVAKDLDLHATLARIVTAAAGLADAQYAALGVINTGGEGLSDFITHGMPAPTVAAIGTLPRGRGILGLIIDEPEPLRLHDLKTHPSSYGFPAHHPPMKSFLGVPVRVGDRVFGNLYLTDKAGGNDFTKEDELAVVALAAAAGVAIENAALFERLRRRELWLSATAEIQDLLLGHVDRSSALTLIAARARDIADADLAVVVLEQNDGSMKIEATSGSGEQLLGEDLPPDGTLSDVMKHGATVILAEGVRMPGLENLTSALLVPFTGPGGAGGALLIGSIDRALSRVWDDDDVQALRGFAAQAALGVDRAQAQEDRAALAILADRDRIARDLHDLVIQRLFATGLTLQSMATRSQDVQSATRLTEAVNNLDATIRDIRSTIFQLGRNGAAADLKSQINAVTVAAEPMLAARPHVEFVGPVESAVPDAVRPHLVAVIVEALSNVGRHAKAEHVDIAVSIEGTGHAAMVVLEVRDDGNGLTPTQGGSGLANMRNRARDLGGAFDIVAAPGEGTLVRWSVPLSRAQTP